jgi:hypothetical protein
MTFHFSWKILTILTAAIAKVTAHTSIFRSTKGDDGLTTEKTMS